MLHISFTFPHNEKRNKEIKLVFDLFDPRNKYWLTDFSGYIIKKEKKIVTYTEIRWWIGIVTDSSSVKKRKKRRKKKKERKKSCAEMIVKPR